jgi:3-hydroxyisobutyrate dehydrogenase-like beta-hydroxyacid dehydrogenase
VWVSSAWAARVPPWPAGSSTRATTPPSARRSATLLPFADTPAKRAASPADLAADSDLVCVCVVDDADVEEVVTGAHGVLAGLRRGGVIAVHSTVHPDTCHRLADRARTHGVALVDAPVSGGGPAAAEGRWW